MPPVTYRAMLRLVAVSAMLGGVGHAQDRPDPLQGRTGPTASGPALPAYQMPPPAQPPVAPPAAVPVIGVESATAGILIADVAVGGATGSAPAAADWEPTTDGITGLSLDRPASAGFDAAWVRQQFVRNGLIGARVPIDRVTALVQMINIALARNGYINSGVRITGGEFADGGVLQLDLVFGRLVAAGDGAPISVAWGPRGAHGLTPDFVIRRMAPANAVPLNAVAVERAFRLLSENPAIATVRADLRPGARPGEATLALTVDPADRYDLYLSTANSRSPAVGGYRAAIGGSIRNLLAAGDIVSAEAGVTAAQPDVAASYQVPIIDAQTTFVVRGGYNQASVVDRPLVALDISARDWNIEGGINHLIVSEPLTLRAAGGWRAARSLSVGWRVGHRETETFLLGQPFSFSPGAVGGRSDYTVLRLVADWVERGISQVTAVSLTLTQGLGGSRVRPTNPADAVALLNLVPNTDFRAALVQASHARRLSRGGLELRLRLTGQWSDGLLYSGERLAAGGEFTVRGYRETLALVDRGVIGSVELYQPFSLSRGGGGGGSGGADGIDLGAFGASVFADGAYLANARDPQPQPGELASVGVGLAWVPTDAFSAKVSYGYAIVGARQVGTRDIQDDGFQFRVTFRPLALFGRR